MQFFASSQEARPGRATTLLPLCNHLLREVVAGAKPAAAWVAAAATSATTYIFNGKGITVVLLDKYTGKGKEGYLIRNGSVAVVADRRKARGTRAGVLTTLIGSTGGTRGGERA